MQPVRKIELAMQFAVPLSPWWLLLFLPMAVAVVVLFYRNQWRDLTRGQAAALVILRGALAAGIVFLAFRPSLLWRTILTFPGRIVLLLDDSQSMTANDTGLSGPDALRRARLLRGTTEDAEAPVHNLARRVEDIDYALRRYERFARTADRTTERFWEETERASQDIAGRFEELARLTQGVTGLSGELQGAWEEALVLFAEARSRAQALFSGNAAPLPQAFQACSRSLADLRDRFYRIQSGLDQVALSDARHPWQAVVNQERSCSRLDVMKAALAGLPSYAAAELNGHFIECRRLMSGARALLAAFKPEELQVVAGATDLLGPLNELLREENPFPLAGIAVISDGRHHGGGSAEATAQLAVQRETPISAAMIGAGREPWDLAVLEAIAPPFAIKGDPVNVRVRLKTALPEPAEARVELLLDGRALAEETFKAGEQPVRPCILRFTPDAVGRHRYTVRVSSLPAEIIPAQNNSRDVVVSVRADKVRVLLLDWKPRWETRFLLNILHRLPFVDLNAIIAVTREEAVLARGIRKGAWPKDRATLAMYDLIVIGDIPPALLTAGEWADIRDAVENGGKALCLLGGASEPALPATDIRQALWPLASEAIRTPAPAANPDSGQTAELFCMTETGRLHPLTAALAQYLPLAGEADAPGLHPDTRLLALAAPGSRPVIATRLVGKGQVLLVDDDRLWKRLNPTCLDAHTALYVNLIVWAVDADRLVSAAGEAMLLDQRVLSAAAGLHVWMSTSATGAIEAVSGGQVVAEQPLARMRPDAALSYATFTSLPAGEVQFRRKGSTTIANAVIVADDSPELGLLARSDTTLAALASGSGGRVAEIADVRQLLAEFAPRDRVEKNERVWRLWDMHLVFAALLTMLTVEWIWRKWMGLV